VSGGSAGAGGGAECSCQRGREERHRRWKLVESRKKTFTSRKEQLSRVGFQFSSSTHSAATEQLQKDSQAPYDPMLTTSTPPEPFLALDPSLPISRFDQSSLLSRVKQKQDQHNEELESEQLFPFPLLNKLISLPFLSPTTAILKQLALLRRDMLSGVYRVLEKLHEKERQDLEEALAGNVQQEKREGAFFLSFSHSALVRLSEHAHGSHLPTETTKSTLSTFLDHFTSAFSALFGRSAAPVDEGTTLDTPSPPRPVLLIDPRSTSEDFDADGARERLRNVQGKEKDRVEGAFRPSRLPADSR
jgi:hypothetical protein